MRSRQEITFRLRQEVANGLLALSSPNLALRADTHLAILPNPNEVANALRGTEYARNLIAIADEILRGRIPILGQIIDYGSDIAWRKDPHRDTETPAKYFRRIPYLDPAAAGDHKFIWEVNRHQHLILLAQAAVLTSDTKYSDHIFRQIERWWAENPFQHGINWTSALEVGFRTLSWLWIFHLAGNRMSETFRQRFLAELYRHGLHLEYNLSIYFSPNTHLLGEAVALHALGRLFPRFPRASKWRSLGGDIVREHMQTSVKEDGSYFEQSTYYHMYAVDMFAFHAVLEPGSRSYSEKLSRMGEFMAAIVSKNGDMPFLGDDDGGRFFHPHGPRPRFPRASLALVSLLAGKCLFPYDEYDLAEIVMWWIGPQRCTAQLQHLPQPESRIFRDTGIVVMRRSAVLAVFDVGPFGPGSAGHSHSDTLSLVVSVGYQEVLIDSGTYVYMDEEWREQFRGSAAHNTLRVDGKNQAVAAGPFRWTEKPQVKLQEFAITSEVAHACGECSYGGFLCARAIHFGSQECTIEDQVSGPAGEHDVEQFWHFAVEPRQISPGKWAIGDVAEFAAEGGVVEQSWRSRCFGTKERAWTIVVRKRTRLPIDLHARLRITT